MKPYFTTLLLCIVLTIIGIAIGLFVGSELTDRRHTAARINYSVMLHSMLHTGKIDSTESAIIRDIDSLSTYLLIPTSGRSKMLVDNLITDICDPTKPPSRDYTPHLLRSISQQTHLSFSPELNQFLQSKAYQSE